MRKIVLVANTDWYLFNFRLSLANTLRERGNEVLLVSPPGRYVSQLKAAGFRWLGWNVGRQSLAPWKELGAVVQLARIYQLERPDLAHHFTVKPVLYGSLAAWLTGVPAVVNAITGLGYVFLNQDKRTRLVRGVVTRLYRFVLGRENTGVIFENDTDRQFFLSNRLVEPDRAWLIEGVGVDSEHFHPTPEPEGCPVIALPARLLWDKGVGILVEAARLLKARREVRVALVGEPDPGNPASIPTSTIHGWVEEGVVEWWGWRNDMREVYAASHIISLPSFGEGVPTVLLEAMASGRPVVTTDVQGCRDVVKNGENGLLVNVRDPQSLADALDQLVRNAELRSQMGAAGRSLVLQKYTDEQINAATLSVYDALLFSPAVLR